MTTDKPHKSLNKLIKSIKAQPEFSRLYNQEAFILDSNESDVLAKIGRSDLSFVSTVLASFKSSKTREQLLQIGKEEIDSFYASVKHVRNKKLINALETLIDEDIKEQQFQDWIKEKSMGFWSRIYKIP